MDDKNIATFSFSGGSCSIDLKSGNVVASVSYDHPDFGGSVALTLKTKAGLDHLKAIIPGSIDDAIINLVEAALGV